MTKHFDQITSQVQKAGSVDQAAPILFNGLAEQITQNRNNPTGLDQIVNELRSGDLAQALTSAQSRGGSGSTRSM